MLNVNAECERNKAPPQKTRRDPPKPDFELVDNRPKLVEFPTATFTLNVFVTNVTL